MPQTCTSLCIYSMYVPDSNAIEVCFVFTQIIRWTVQVNYFNQVGSLTFDMFSKTHLNNYFWNRKSQQQNLNLKNNLHINRPYIDKKKYLFIICITFCFTLKIYLFKKDALNKTKNINVTKCRKEICYEDYKSRKTN